MKPIEWLRNQRLEGPLLLGLAAISVGFALADRSVLGFEPPMLAVLAAVFAATSSIYL